MNPIYLDYNATTPIDLEVREAMLPYLNIHFGNPSSTHWYGTQAKKAVERTMTAKTTSWPTRISASDPIIPLSTSMVSLSLCPGCRDYQRPPNN